MNEQEKLLVKSEGVKESVKWLEKRIKTQQKELKERDWYYNWEGKQELEAVVKELIDVKISLEKYSKKLKHQSEEISMG